MTTRKRSEKIEREITAKKDAQNQPATMSLVRK